MAALKDECVKMASDKRFFSQARHFLNIHNPFHSLHLLNEIKGESHLILHMLIALINARAQFTEQQLYEHLDNIALTLKNPLIKSQAFFHRWNLSIHHCLRVLEHLILHEDEVDEICTFLKNGDIPMCELKSAKPTTELFPRSEAALAAEPEESQTVFSL